MPVVTVTKTDEFQRWLDALRDRRAAAKILSRIDRAEDGNLGDVAPAGEGVSEMHIHYGPGYWVYFTARGKKLIILLCGGDKSMQDGDIRRAKEIAREL